MISRRPAAYTVVVDLGAVKAARKSQLISCAVGAAVNAGDLLGDAEWLSEAVRRLLEWHQLKLVGGMLIGAMPFGGRALPAQLAAMPASRIAGMLGDAEALAQDLDRLKQRGLYADIDRSGQIRLPPEVSGAEVAAQLGQARRAVSAASLLLDPSMPAELAHPPAESVDLARALVDAFAEAGHSRTPKAAADVVLNAVRRFQTKLAESDAGPRSGPARRGRQAGDDRSY